MTDYLTLAEFVPGTKAKAQEVNANFLALKDAVNQKAAMEGDSTQTFSVANAATASHAVNKGQLDGLSTNLTAEINKTGTKFCVKSGNVTNGKGDLFSYSVLTITPKIGGVYPNLVFSDYRGTRITISSASTISMSGKPNGNYNIFIKPDGTFYTLNNTIYRQAARPTMLAGDVWFNFSKEPFDCIKYDGTSDIEFLDMPLGKVTIASNAITAIETFPFNQNGYNVNINSFTNKKYDYANPVSKSSGVTYTAESDGLLFCYSGDVGSTSGIYIEGVLYLINGADSAGTYGGAGLPVSKGQVYNFYSCSSCYFIPQIVISNY